MCHRLATAEKHYRYNEKHSNSVRCSCLLHHVGLAPASHTVWHVPKWPSSVSVSSADEIIVTCTDKAVICIICPPTGKRMYTVPLYEMGITKPWHAFCLAVTAAGPSHRVWLMSRDCKTKRFYGGTGQLLSARCLLPWTANQDCVLICDQDNCRNVAVNFSCDEETVKELGPQVVTETYNITVQD